MSTTTTQTHLIDCPVCKGRVIANLTYDVKANPAAYAEGSHIGPIDKTVTATLTLTGVRIQHECPKLTIHRGGGFIPPTLPADDLLTRED